MNAQIETRIDSFCTHFGLQPGDLMTRSFPMGPNGTGGVGTEIILGANDPSKSEGRVKIDPAGNFIVFTSNQPVVVEEGVVFEQAASLVEENRIRHISQTLLLEAAIKGGWKPYPL